MSKSSSGSGIIASMLIVLVISIGLPVGGFGLGYGTGVLRYDVLGPPYQELAQPENTENNQSTQNVQKGSIISPNLRVENGEVIWRSEMLPSNEDSSTLGDGDLIDKADVPPPSQVQDSPDLPSKEPIVSTSSEQTPPQTQNPAQSQGTSQNAGNANQGGNSTESKPSSSQTQTGVKIDPSSPSANKSQNGGTNRTTQSGGEKGNNNNLADLPEYEREKKGEYIGSSISDKYHPFPGCSAAKKIKPENEVWFNSVEEARAANYKPCGNCFK